MPPASCRNGRQIDIKRLSCPQGEWLRRENRWDGIERRYFASPKPHSGPTALFAASKPLEEASDICRTMPDPLLGWDSLVEVEISAHRIAGDHHGILFEEPGVTELAELLRSELAAAGSDRV